MNIEAIAKLISAGKGVLGIELGSTRIKAVLIGEDHSPIASGDHTWENRLENGVWTYHLDDVWAGIQDAYANMVADVKAKYGVELTRLAAFGVSAMMHGYLNGVAALPELHVLLWELSERVTKAPFTCKIRVFTPIHPPFAPRQSYPSMWTSGA